MNILKDYVCPSCGGQLSRDEDRGMLLCNSCGRLIEYEFFQGDDMLSSAYKSLQNREFDSAGKKFDFLVRKETTNYSAWRGLYFAEKKVRSIADIAWSNEKLSICGNKRCIDESPDIFHPIFEKLNSLTDTVNCKYEKTQELNKAQNRISEYESKSGSIKQDIKTERKSRLSLITIILIIALIVIFMLGAFVEAGKYMTESIKTAVILFVIIIALILIVPKFLTYVKISRYKAEIRQIKYDIGSEQKTVKNISDEIDKINRRITELLRETEEADNELFKEQTYE